MIKRELHMEMRNLAWMAGLLEGEGTFLKGSPAKPRRPALAVGMADEDVVGRMSDLWGTRLWTIRLENPRYKPVFRTELVGGSAVAMMTLLRPHMGQRRQQQIDEAIATYQPLRSIKHKRFYVSDEGADEFDRHWLAGLLEGEAYFGLHKASARSFSPIVELNTVDADVIARVRRIYAERYAVAVNIHTRPPRREGYQPQYHLACHGDAARAVMADIAPLMGARRAGRIDALLGAYVQPRLIREARPCYHICRAA